MTSQRKPAFLRGGPNSYGMLVISSCPLHRFTYCTMLLHSLHMPCSRAGLVHGSLLCLVYSGVAICLFVFEEAQSSLCCMQAPQQGCLASDQISLPNL